MLGNPVQNSNNFMDIEKNIRNYVKDIKPFERYASFDYCFNYFQSFREQNKQGELASPENLQESCLQLGFYLASWGMLRGSSFLLGKSVKVYEPLITAIAKANPILWNIDANCYTSENINNILEFREEVVRSFDGVDGGYHPSDILVTKIMLGVFGNVPAFDSFFKKGFGVRTFGNYALEKVSAFYQEHSSVIENSRLPTIDFLTGQPTSRLYTRAKVIDMIFFIEGGKS